MEEDRWAVMFYRRDMDSVEKYYYWHEDEARMHFNMFRDFDDFTMYSRIELVLFKNDDIEHGKVIDCIWFDKAA